jgi:DNA-binding MarR family transcriptional regulator
MSGPSGNGRRGNVDYVDLILEQWQQECPDLDVSPIAIVGRLSRLSRILEQSIELLYSEYGVQGGRFSVLAALLRSGSPYRLSPTELSRSLLVTSGAMTNRLEHLARLGLISRERDPRDRRFALVVLTEKGRALTEKILRAHLENERALLAALNAKSQASLTRLLRALLLSFDDRPDVEWREARHLVRGSPHGDRLVPARRGLIAARRRRR